MNRTIRQKYNKDVEYLNTAINQQNLTDMYSTMHSTKAEYTYFSSTHETFSMIDHMKVIKQASINLRTELQSPFSDHME